MHEMAITEQLLSTALRHAEQAGAARITRLNLVVGQFASVVDDSVQFYWDFIAKGTIAEGAILHFRRIPGVLTCRDCGASFPIDRFEGQCPGCGGEQVSVVSGDEFQLESIEVEEAREQIVQDD
jgi:hydrogenase nickel incorporation protein HypA/HybF